MAALRKEMFRVGFLKIGTANFVAGNLCGNGEGGDKISVTVVEPINQMQVTGTATSGTDGQASRAVGVGAGGERSGFFVSYVNPARSLSSANGVGDPVERVAGDSVDSLYSGADQRFDQ